MRCLEPVSMIHIEFGLVGIEHIPFETLLIKMHSLVKRGMIRRGPNKMG